MDLSIQTQIVINLYILFSSLQSCLHKQIFTKQQPYNKYEKGSLGVPRVFWVPNTFPLHNQPPYPDLWLWRFY